MKRKISTQELLRHFNLCVQHTPNLPVTPDFVKGFNIGFRMYERMAAALGKEVTEEESESIQALSKPVDTESTGGK